MKKTSSAILGGIQTLALASALAIPSLAASAWADDAPATSTTDSQSLMSKLQKNFSFTYWSAFSGPSVLRPGAYQVDPTSGAMDPSKGSPITWANQFKLDYKITDNVFVGPVVNFTLRAQPVTSSGLNEQILYMNDSGVRIGAKHIVHNGGLDLFADFRVMAPIDPTHTGEYFGMQSLQNLSYEIPNTKLTAAVLGFDVVNVYGSGGSGKNIDFYLGPNLSYQVTKPLAITLWVDLELANAVQNPFVLRNSFSPVDIAPGISWDVSKNFNISPQLVFYPTMPGALGSTVYLSAKFL